MNSKKQLVKKFGKEIVAAAEAVLAKMSLAEKVGQVMCVGIDGFELEDEAKELIQKNALGGIILFGRNLDSVSQVARLTYQIQKAARDAGHPGLFITIDQQGGRVLRLTEGAGFTETLSGLGIGAVNDPDVSYRAGLILGEEMKAVGINWNLAPNIDPGKPRGAHKGDKTQPFGMHQDLVGEMGRAFIRGTQEAGVMATMKHFPGSSLDPVGMGVDGHLGLNTEQDTFYEMNQWSWIPFRLSMREDPASVMVTHSAYPNVGSPSGIPASVDPKIYTILKETVRFDGLVITDSLEMGALPEAGYPVDIASAAALAAGADVLLHQRNHEDHRKCLAEVERQVTEGEIPLERLDDAVLRGLVYKLAWGIFDVDVKEPDLDVLPGVEERRAQSRADAVRAITVLKNEKDLLPLTADQEVLVIEYGAAHGTTWQPGIVQPGQIRGLGEKLGAETYVLEHLELTDEEIEDIVEAGKGKTVIAITSEAMESNFQQRLVEALHEAIDELIVIAMRGPYDIRVFPYIHTYVVSYGFNPAHMDALVAVLTGKEKPQGKLPVDIPDLFPRGTGLTY